MIPKSKRRIITIDGNKYEYCVTGCINVYAKNLQTGKQIHWGDEWKKKWEQKITPSDIKTLIETKELYGIKSR